MNQAVQLQRMKFLVQAYLVEGMAKQASPHSDEFRRRMAEFERLTRCQRVLCAQMAACKMTAAPRDWTRLDLKAEYIADKIRITEIQTGFDLLQKLTTQLLEDLQKYQCRENNRQLL